MRRVGDYEGAASLGIDPSAVALTTGSEPRRQRCGCEGGAAFMLRSEGEGDGGAALIASWRARARRVAPWVAVVVALVAYSAGFRGTYIDDTYISLQYARNLAEHGTWGFYPYRATNTATSPLNVVVTAAVGLVTGSLVDAVVWLTAAELALLLLVLLRISAHLFGSPHFGVFAFVALGTNPLLLSSLGLESLLYALLMLLSVHLFLLRRWFLLSLSLALLTLTRPDGVLLFVTLMLLARAPVKTLGKVAVWYGLAMLPWFLFSWIRLGSLVPDTLLIKIEQTTWGSTTVANGARLYLDRFPFETVASVWLLPLLPLALLPLRRCGSEVRLLVGALVTYAVGHYVIYSAMGVPPYHWYFIHQVVPIVVVGSVGVSYLLRPIAFSSRWIARLAAYAPVLLPAGAILWIGATNEFPLQEAPIHTNWAIPSQYQTLGLWLRDNLDPSATVEVRGEIGTPAFFSQRYLIDDFADMNRTNKLVEQFVAGVAPPLRGVLRANFAWRRDQEPFPPPAYVLDFAPAAKAAAPDETTVMVWETSGKWAGKRRVSLRSVSPPPPSEPPPPGSRSIALSSLSPPCLAEAARRRAGGKSRSPLGARQAADGSERRRTP